MARAAALSMKCPEEAMSKSMETLLRFRWSERPHSVVIAVPVVVLTWSVSDVISILFDRNSSGVRSAVGAERVRQSGDDGIVPLP